MSTEMVEMNTAKTNSESNYQVTVEIPKGVEIQVDGKAVTVKGPKGTLSRDFSNPTYNNLVKIEKNCGIVVSASSEKRKMKAVAGTIRAHIRNMMLGVTDGYRYTMKILYSHFPMTVDIKGDEIHVKNFLGEKGARVAKIKGKTEVKVDKDEITLSGIDLENIGQTVQRIEQACRLTGKDRRIFQDGIFLTGRYTQTGKPL